MTTSDSPILVIRAVVVASNHRSETVPEIIHWLSGHAINSCRDLADFQREADPSLQPPQPAQKPK